MADNFSKAIPAGNIPTGLGGLARRTAGIGSLSGSDGVYSFAGRLISWERRPELQGRNQYVTFDNLIANTVIVAAAIRYFQSLVGGTSWTISPNEDAGADGERAAEIVKAGLIEANMTLPWSAIVKKAALFKYYGFSIHEWCVRRRGDGMVVFKDIEHRPQHTIDMWDIPDEGGPFRGVVQLVPMRPEYFYVPRNRMFYCVDNTLTDSPNGVGLLRHVVEHGRRLERYEQLEGFGHEGSLRGMPVGRVPGKEIAEYAEKNGLSADWVKEQIAAVKALVRNHIKTPFQGIVLDSAPYDTGSLGTMTPTFSPVPKWAIELIKGDAAGLEEINVVIERINREIARVLGMEFLLLGGDGKGSLALSRDKTSMFAAVLESTLGELAWFTKHDLVYPLLELNGLDPEMCAPQVNPDPIATERIETVIQALVGLAQAGAVLLPDDPAINQVRQRLHLADQPKLPPDIMSARMGLLAGKPPGGKPGKPDPNAPNEGREDEQDQGDAPKKPTPRDRAATEKHARSLFRVIDEETRLDKGAPDPGDAYVPREIGVKPKKTDGSGVNSTYKED